MMKHMLASAAIVASAGVAAAQQGELGIPVGGNAPAAVVQTLDGKDANLSTYIGKGPVVIEFWATWCENCRALEPQLMSLVKQYAGTVQFVGVAVSANESAARVQAYAKKHAFTHAIFFDTHGVATGAYDVPATSYVVVINKAGVIVYTGVGGDQDLAAAIKKAL
jgi:thiol-disulfide isomerase/thioredoxin